jgi:acetyltransferase-like isoleucine patch superfamily enzyme
MSIKIHPTADISPGAEIGEGTKIWHHAQVRDKAVIGENCSVGQGVYIDSGVIVGDRVKIQSGAFLPSGLRIEDGVFIGPHVCFTNDLYPRSINPDGSLKNPNDWKMVETLIKQGASLGANSTILCGITIGQWAMVGAGSAAVKDVPDNGLVVGNPAKLIGYICQCGKPIHRDETEKNSSHICNDCGTATIIRL